MSLYQIFTLSVNGREHKLVVQDVLDLFSKEYKLVVQDILDLFSNDQM